MIYSFPTTIYDRPRQLLAALGTFWTRVYESQDELSAIADGLGLVESQSMLEVLELIASLSRFEVPIFHRDAWQLLTLRESQRNDYRTSLLRYDAGGVYDTSHRYDVAADQPLHSYPLPADLVRLGTITNRFIEPTLIWTDGVNFTIDQARQALVFNIDPFSDPRLVPRPVYTDGLVTDREVGLWLYRGEYDFEHIYRQFGYAIGLRMASSEGYRELLNAVLDAITGGTAFLQVQAALAAITGIPVVREATETVEELAYDGSHRLVITDRNVYKFQLSSLPTVAVGDTVRAGDTLTDQLRIYEFNRGQLDDALTALAIGRGFLANCYYGPLIFENRDVPLEVDAAHGSGYTYVSFSLGGFPLDVEKFFDEVHERGVAEAERPIDPCDVPETVEIPGDPCDDDNPTVFHRRGTLAHLLDTRETRIEEPTAASLPGTINPLRFLVENVLRGNTFVCYIKTAGLHPNALGLQHLRWLTKLLPPATAVLFVVELTAQQDQVPASLVEDGQLSTLDATEPLIEVIDPAVYVDASKLWAHYVTVTCH